MGRSCVGVIGGFLLAGVTMAVAARPAPLENADCLACHSDKDLSKKDAAGTVVSPFVDEQQFSASIHGRNKCTSCHVDIAEVPHPERFSAKPVACSRCHRVETGIYLLSDHGQAVHTGVSEAASCKDCHGNNHYLLNSRNPASPGRREALDREPGGLALHRVHRAGE